VSPARHVECVDDELGAEMIGDGTPDDFSFQASSATAQ
jgi:hypothetical protein